MFMHYHWGLGIGHTYAHTTASTYSGSTSQQLQSPHSSRHDKQDVGHSVNDKITEAELDNLESKLDSESSGKSQSDLESIFGDYIDMYGSDVDVLDGYYVV